MAEDFTETPEEQNPTAPKPKSPIAEREEAILAFWNKEKIFEKSLNKPAPKGEFVFYDGPPFATGLPHFGHILPTTIKDAIPRYRTMQGYRVPRRWGWDCHGLPLENQIEQELGIKNKRQIEELGVGKFNAAARAAVVRYTEDWKRIIPRLGRWADMELDYKTMDAPYTESVWWAFKNLYDRGLVYEDFKAMHFCPRCGTTLSNNEVAQGYKDIDDIAVTVKLPLVDEPNTALLIWTTTPWTLPGNSAAAVKEDAIYVKVKNGEEFFVVAKALAEKFFSNPEIVGELKGKELVGKRYEPPFNYFKNEVHKHKTHAWRVYAAPYVTLEDGTGIVHLAPAYGAEDLALAQKEKIPLIHHVDEDGRFVATVADFAGLPVKPKGNPKETDEKVAAWLEQNGKLFKQEKITHSYPHCWRCDTPLLNWAANSWFVNVQKVKSKLVAENKKVTWVPENVGSGRFKNGLETAPDWAISRSRFWGAPLPVWRHSKSKEIKVIGSVKELLGLVRKSGNRYFLMRHGEAAHNVQGLIYSDNTEDGLTEKGCADVLAAAQMLRKKGSVDLIVASPLQRTQETARIVQKELGLVDSALMTDERLREVGFGVFSGKKLVEWDAFFGEFKNRFHNAPEGGESYTEVRRRIGEFLFDLERRYVGKNILIVTHGGPSWHLYDGIAERHSISEYDRGLRKERGLEPAEVREVPFTPYPHNEDYELDLHRPYIDELPTGDSLGGHWHRVKDVFDCWFESGSMPFASNHYPFEKNNFNPKRVFGLFAKGYPADFISESIDQTRGWFYSLMVLGVALFGKRAYNAVITNGLVLAADGRKMSKKLKNYPEVLETVALYGADALRYYLVSSPVVRGGDVSFVARGVEEVSKKLLMRLDNVRSFYFLYAPQRQTFAQELPASLNVLDRWIFARLGELVKETTDGFEKYELDTATRPLMGFVDDLSTWYLRRSRERFKTEGAEKEAALTTLRQVLMTLSQLMAPVMPFYADYLHRELRQENDAESVHLSNWPAAPAVDEKLLAEMKLVRELASAGLELREKAGMKIRQPLASLAVTQELTPDFAEILKDELNVKEVKVGKEVALDTALTPELKEEGLVRELARRIQDWRKEEKMQISDRPRYTFKANTEEKRVAEKYKQQLIEQTGLAGLTIEDA